MIWFLAIIVLFVLYAASQRSETKVQSNPTASYVKPARRKAKMPVREKFDKTKANYLWDKEINGSGLTVGGPWDTLRKRIIARDSNKCVQCGASVNLTVDHITELSLGGTNDPSNLRTLCITCHHERHGREFMNRSFNHDDNYGVDYNPSRKVMILQEALNSSEPVGIKYIDYYGLYSERVIRPVRLFSKKAGNYVEAFCELDNDVRHFKLSRLRIVKTRENFYEGGKNPNYKVWLSDEEWAKKTGQ